MNQSNVQPQAQEGVKLHPISLYLKVWVLLFVLSTLSYLVDYFQLQGGLRWSLILIFMFLKAGFILAIFMHVTWERIALKLVLFLPPLAIVVLIVMMAIEGDYTFLNRLLSFISS
ncbi:cytochrome C oxidase subunit IV family protein [Thalassomonas haliotis]|uniref:Cytochrome C oxidase subunit IV family protein n=1 Tax=Thalassomonas haliotis TaxID=485448 RepID=A0ABY7VD25_9GAMM|nr:cytochrome C oxidase subunit IV family protein [Thalassomonas haliotis]WDE11256.1 cytochrome C oxidase subunit IV family protein [Thalassomonas haliotis]